MQMYKENILNFSQFMKKAIPVMEDLKQKLKKMVETRDLQNQAYSQIV